MRVLVTGANGYLGSHIVQQLLQKDIFVHACVRDASNLEKVAHLQQLPQASTHLTLFSTGDLRSPKGKFDEPMATCTAVVHAATPVQVKFAKFQAGADTITIPDLEQEIYAPALASTHEILDTIARQRQSALDDARNNNDESSDAAAVATCTDVVRTLILTSSMSAVAPFPEPPIKDESHWSDPERQKANKSWYGATKTVQEHMVQDWVEQSNKEVATNNLPTIRYVSICPTMLLGPFLNPLNPTTTPVVISGTMGRLVDWLRGEKCQAVPNDSMSWIHVQDCARMHVTAVTDETSQGRYMGVVESWHWNSILTRMHALHPALPDFTPVAADIAVEPTQFGMQRTDALVGVDTMRSMEVTLQESIEFLYSIGALEK